MTSNNIKDLLIRRSYLYNDWGLFNELGHEDVARGLLEVTKYLNASYNDTVIPWDENNNADESVTYEDPLVLNSDYTCEDCPVFDEDQCKANALCVYNDTHDPTRIINCASILFG